jgi:hypothetical protein
VTCPPRRKPEENREREIKQTLYSPHKGKRNSVTIMGCRGNACGIVISVGICICITVTANCAGLEFGAGHVECVDRCRVIPVVVCKSSLFENLLRLVTMVIEVGAKVGSGTPVLGTLARVLVVLLGPMGTLTQVLDVEAGEVLYVARSLRRVSGRRSLSGTRRNRRAHACCMRANVSSFSSSRSSRML